MSNLEKTYQLAKEKYQELGIDTDKVIELLKSISVSIHCWQGDDVGGFENPDGLSGGGIQATGNYPGKATTADQLRADMDKALCLIPGKHRVNLHSIYAETNGKKVDRDELQPQHFENWLNWAQEKGLKLDFNGSFFSHPKADSGFTLASSDEDIRKFWIEHGKRVREIAAHFGKTLKSPAVTNVWIPDGYKDTPADRKTPRLILKDSLDNVFADKIDEKYNIDAVESKLFGIGSESYVVGSHEFYIGYAIQNKKALCLDAGHFHPTEVISDKISSVLTFVDKVLLHVSRGVRWDSDHIVTLNDELQSIAQELVRGEFTGRVNIGLDFFDASVNRLAAWVIGVRSMIKALLIALLEPSKQLQEYEKAGDYTSRLALMEELKTYPFGAVWDYYCLKDNVPIGLKWMDEVKTYEKDVLAER